MYLSPEQVQQIELTLSSSPSTHSTKNSRSGSSTARPPVYPPCYGCLFNSPPWSSLQDSELAHDDSGFMYAADMVGSLGNCGDVPPYTVWPGRGEWEMDYSVCDGTYRLVEDLPKYREYRRRVKVAVRKWRGVFGMDK